MRHSALLEEDFPARIEAVFPDRASAAAAATALCQRFDIDNSQISVVSPERESRGTHRNRFAHRASGRSLQKRQLRFTLIAFALILIGLVLLQVFSAAGALPPAAAPVILALLICAAVGLTVTGLLSWRPARVDAHTPHRRGDTVLLIEVHDVSEQYPLRQALLELGARPESADIAGHN